jgi:hypothetical protein
MAAGGIGSAVVAMFLFCWPAAALAVWPWQLTPLTSRVIAGWFALSAGSALMMAQESRWSASRGAVQGGIVFAALQLAAIVRAWSDFDPGNPLTWVYVALVASTLVGLLWLYLTLEARRRRVPGSMPEAARASP